MPSHPRDCNILRDIELHLRQDDADFVELFSRIEGAASLASLPRSWARPRIEPGYGLKPPPHDGWFNSFVWQPRSPGVAALISLPASIGCCLLIGAAAGAHDAIAQVVLLMCLPLTLLPLVRCNRTAGSDG